MKSTKRRLTLAARFVGAVAVAYFGVAPAAQAHVGLLIDSNKFTGPRAIALAPDGETVFVVDGHPMSSKLVFKARVGRADPELFAGTRDAGPGMALLPTGPIDPHSARNTGLMAPTAIAVSPDGETVFIADGLRILRIRADGTQVSILHSHPVMTMALSSDGRTIYAADNQHGIHRIDVATGVSELFAGGHGEGSRIDPENALNTQLNLKVQPALAISPSGRDVYVADTYNDRILRLRTDGRKVELIAGGEGLEDRFNSHNSLETAVLRPGGIAVSLDEQWIYVGTQDSVLAIKVDRTRVKRVVGGAGSGDQLNPRFPRATQLKGPLLAPVIAPDGSLIVADPFGKRIVFVGAEDELEVNLNRLIESNSPTSLRDLQLLASPSTRNVVAAVDRTAAGFDRNDEIRQPQLNGTANRHRSVLRAPGTRALPADLWDMIFSHADEPRGAQRIKRFRAQLAVGIAKSMVRAN